VTNRRRPRGRSWAGLAGVMVGILAVAAGCGSTAPTPSPTAAPTATPTPSPTPTPTPMPTIYPVPTWQPAPPAAARPTSDAATAAALQAAIRGVQARGAIPGLSAAVVFPDGSIWAGQAGVLVRGGSQKVTPDTLFCVGSITKTFTSALTLRLAERGTLGLDDPVSKYLPSYPNGAKITIRMLLDHTSGIRDLFDDSVFRYFDADHSRRWTADQVLALATGPYFSPGTKYHYSTTNYVLLGEIIETATGKTLVELVRSEFLQPLGLSHTFLQWEEDPGGPVAHGYWGNSSDPTDLSVGQVLIPYASEATASGAGGAIISTASDIARWGAALYSGGILDPAYLASLVDTTATSRFKPQVPYGLGVEARSVNGHPAWGHSGHLDGFKAQMVYVPDSGVTVVLLTNADWIDPLRAASAIYAAIPMK
jgi:D-alanyl-D-alanine carboxypeptidase